MEENKIVDTTDFLSEEDERLLVQIEYIKQNILNFIKPEVMVDKIRQIIEKSTLFGFKSKRNAKYISNTKPLFILTMDKQLAEKNRNYSFKYKDGMEVEDTNLVGDYNFINDCIHTEITSKYSEFLTDQLTNNEEFLKILNENSIDTKKISREQLRIISFVTASIFGVTIEIRQNIIYLEYVI